MPGPLANSEGGSYLAAPSPSSMLCALYVCVVPISCVCGAVGVSESECSAVTSYLSSEHVFVIGVGVLSAPARRCSNCSD